MRCFHARNRSQGLSLFLGGGLAPAVGSDRPSRFRATRLERSSAVPSEAQMCGAHPGRAGERIEVSALLLNEVTDEKDHPGATYATSGNLMDAPILDLDRPFDEIRAQLEGIGRAHFPS